MKIESEVTFENAEIAKLLEDEYRRMFGVPDGYSTEGFERYSEWRVKLVKDEEPEVQKEEEVSEALEIPSSDKKGGANEAKATDYEKTCF